MSTITIEDELVHVNVVGAELDEAALQSMFAEQDELYRKFEAAILCGRTVPERVEIGR